MAAWQAQEWIRECVQSIKSQEMPPGWAVDLRIGVDGCAATADAIAAMDQPYYWTPKNVGAYVLRNSLVAAGPADCYAIFDADDLMFGGYLATLIKDAGSDGIAGAGRRTINRKGIMLRRGYSRYHSGVCMISAAAWHRLGGYRDYRIAADADLILRAKLLGIPVYSRNRPLFARRRHARSLTQAAPTKFGSVARKAVIAECLALRRAGNLSVTPKTCALEYRDPTSAARDWEINRILRVSGGREGRERRDGLKHTVYTRLKYDTDDAVLNRLALFRNITAPAMAAQVECRPVRWVFLCRDRHAAMIEQAVRAGRWKGELGFNNRDDTRDIQTTLDSDDWIAPNWLADVQRRYTGDDVTRILYWQPMRFELATGRWFKPKRPATWPSMFYSVYHPNDVIHVYATQHPKLCDLPCPVDAADSECMVALTIHGRNVHTKLKGNEIRVPTPRGARIASAARNYVVR
jgi:glycosyltransferase involved in cell wall biosynthesis